MDLLFHFIIQLAYIYHSGFTAETEDHFLVFDYYKGQIKLPDKPIIVFASHGHADHYNPLILDWQKQQAEISYVLSHDIKLASQGQEQIHHLAPYEELELDGLQIKTFGSTDLGVSFLVHAEGKYIFPMHFGQDYDITGKFAQLMAGSGTEIFRISKENQVFKL